MKRPLVIKTIIKENLKIIVVNPNSGFGKKVDSNYVKAINKVKNKQLFVSFFWNSQNEKKRMKIPKMKKRGKRSRGNSGQVDHEWGGV